MPRRKFPSDGKSWWRCLDDILRDPALNGDCPASVAWAYIRLLAWLSESGSRDGKITLDRRALCFIMGRAQHRHAESIARALAVRSLCTLSVRGVHSVITVPKWPIIQGFATEVRNPKAEESKGKKRRGKPNPAKRRNPKKKPPTPETPCPEDLTSEQWAEVRSWRDRKHPEIDDPMLLSEWEKHSAYWRTKEERRPNWVASFEKWLLKALEIQKSDPRAERSQPPVFTSSREPPPDPPTEAEMETARAEMEENLKGTRLEGRRRNRKTVSGKERGRQGSSDSEPDQEE